MSFWLKKEEKEFFKNSMKLQKILIEKNILETQRDYAFAIESIKYDTNMDEVTKTLFRKKVDNFYKTAIGNMEGIKYSKIDYKENEE